jgi:CheY-like chemotaxis protein
VYLPFVTEMSAEVSSSVQRGTVLVIEDDPDVLSVVVFFLREAGFAVSTATNGVEGLERACHHTPDAIVLDMYMPIMSGAEFIKAWRRTATTRCVPIVAMSAYGPEQIPEDLGVHAFLPKPFAPDTLISVVAAALGHQ